VNSSTQLKALLRNLSKEKNINAQILLRNYMLERLLERISLSKYKDSFILKGGMLISAMLGIDMRSTLDMDATIKGFEGVKWSEKSYAFFTFQENNDIVVLQAPQDSYFEKMIV
jgi:hypothetical protein